MVARDPIVIQWQVEEHLQLAFLELMLSFIFDTNSHPPYPVRKFWNIPITLTHELWPGNCETSFQPPILKGIIWVAYCQVSLELLIGPTKTAWLNLFEQIRFQGTESSRLSCKTNSTQTRSCRFISIHTVINTFPISARLKLLSPSALSWLNSNLCCHIHCRSWSNAAVSWFPLPWFCLLS